MYPSNKKKKVWREEKERLLKMTIEERRKEYIRDYVPLNTIPSWKEEMKGKSQNDGGHFLRMMIYLNKFCILKQVDFCCCQNN
ncbi:ADP-ribose glycohydrolase MACROD2 isoform X2 [Bubalus kerabau]|uniref:ADP-ribose glycohydrolase MACROD2 isoform X2 n=1 Tax=Bubalus carabanensis TaxID=3119969 RepID=UPI00244ED469|nr:ADP-ribose glycohydrolase MACROD2 isoform X2 [Bubalus carabanensis]